MSGPKRPSFGAGQAWLLALVVTIAAIGVLVLSRSRDATVMPWVAFGTGLIVAGLLGLGVLEFIARRVRQMTSAAAALAGGDFGQQLPTGLIPDEIFEVSESYNSMAATLGKVLSALQEREREIATVVESMGEGVVAFDSKGMVRVINAQAILLLGLTGERDEIAGRHVTGLTDIGTILDFVDRGLAGSDVSDTTVLGARTVLLHSTAIPSADGGADGAVLIMGDITEQTRLKEAQRRFVANASHEMRTPITALKGFVELLQGGAKDDPAVRDDFLNTMSLEVDRLGRLVSDMLTLAQLETGSLTLYCEPVPIREMFGEIVTVMNSLADDSGVTLALDIPQAPLEVDCDRDRVTQVLLGFIDNALKHSPRGGTVTICARPHDGAVWIEVRDRGRGIAPEDVEHLFERFYRVDESRAASRGTGLGLAIAKEIIEAHGSAIVVESRLGEGSSFGFDLPVVAERTGA